MSIIDRDVVRFRSERVHLEVAESAAISPIEFGGGGGGGGGGGSDPGRARCPSPGQRCSRCPGGPGRCTGPSRCIRANSESDNVPDAHVIDSSERASVYVGRL